MLTARCWHARRRALFTVTLQNALNSAYGHEMIERILSIGAFKEHNALADVIRRSVARRELAEGARSHGARV